MPDFSSVMLPTTVYIPYLKVFKRAVSKYFLFFIVVYISVERDKIII